MAQAGYQRKQAGAVADRRRGGAREVDRPQDRHRRRWRTRSRRLPSRATAARTTSAARSIPRPARPSSRACCRWSSRSRTTSTQVTLADAKRRNPEAKVGDLIAETLPPLDFGRVSAQNAKQVIVQKVREAERERQHNEYKDRMGEIANGTVKRVEYGNVIVDLGRAEGIIRRDEMIPRENVRLGDRIRAYIYDVRREQRGPADFPVARAARVHVEAVRAGGAGDLRRHRADQVGGARSGLAGPRSPSSPRIARSIPSAPASACAASACRPWSASCRARRSTSSSGTRMRRPSSSTRWRRPRSPRWCWTRTPTASRWWCPRASSRSPSAGAARTSGSPRS